MTYTFRMIIMLATLGCAQEQLAQAEPEPGGTATVKTLQAEPAPAEDLTQLGTDWASFLGPSHRGLSGETGLLTEWPKQGPPLLWSKEIGSGYSAPSIQGTQIALHHLEADKDTVSLLNAADGSTLWSISYPNNFSDPFGYDSGPRCTPILTANHVYTLGAQGMLMCLNRTDGSTVWSHDLNSEYQIPELFFGIGCTPVLEDNRLFVLVGGQPNSGVIAFDATTGKPLWNAVGKQTWDGVVTGEKRPETYTWTGEEMVVSYSSPVLATIRNKRMLLCLVRHGLVALDPQTGSEYFHYWFRSKSHESVNATCPIVICDEILLTAAYDVGSVLLRVNPDGKGVEELWKQPKLLQAHWSTPVVHAGVIWAFSGRHENASEMQCVDWKTGQLLWSTTGTSEPPQGLVAVSSSTVKNTVTQEVLPWPYYGRGSAIWVSGKLIVMGERGTLALLDATSDSWKESSRCKVEGVDYPSWTAPVLSQKRLYLRGEHRLNCYNLQPQ